MSVKYPSKGSQIKGTDGLPIASQTLTATEQSGWMAFDDVEWVGLAVDCGTVSGTSPTLDVRLQLRFNEGSEIYGMPAAQNSSTTAVLTQMTTTGDNDCRYFRAPFPSAGRNAQFRVNFAIGGTSPSFEIDGAEVFLVERTA